MPHGLTAVCYCCNILYACDLQENEDFCRNVADDDVATALDQEAIYVLNGEKSRTSSSQICSPASSTVIATAQEANMDAGVTEV
jgi:hypothetical protein